MTAAYPITLDVSQRQIVIIGGGKVATRKVKGLLDAGASRIRVVSPVFNPEMPTQIERITATYSPQYLADAALVFAATDNPAVNQAITRDAHARNLWVNRADADEESDFSTPAAARSGEILLTVSAGGSPALAGVIRDSLQAHLEPGYVAMAAAMQQLRPRIKAASPSIETRRLLFRDLASPAAIEFLQQHNLEALWNWLKQKHPGIAD